MPNKYNLTGKQFGRLTVLEEDFDYVYEHNIKNKSTRYWKCQCSCGKIKSIAQTSLIKNVTQSCGCLSRELSSQRSKQDLTGMIFNRLTVIKEAPKKVNNTHSIWHCLCRCGNECDVASDKLLSGNTQSCGCLALENLKQGRGICCTAKDISGQKFGLLTAIRPTDDRYFGSIVWLCQCECGNYINIPQNHLVNNNTQSCGCLSSKGEANIQKVLEQNNIKFEKEKTFNDLKSNTNHFYRYDFYLPEHNRLIEFDGEQHFSYTDSGWNTKEKFEKTQHSDRIKNEYAKFHKIPLVRIPYQERNNITLDILMDDLYLVN